MSVVKFLIFCTLSSFATQQGPSLFQMKKGEMILSKKLKQQILSKHQDFQVLQPQQFSKAALKNSKGHPMAITGDFNGDGKKDLAFSGFSRKEKKFYYYAAISKKTDKSYELKIVSQHTIDPKQKFSDMGTYLTLGDAKLIDASRDTVQIETDTQQLMTVEPYYFSRKNNRFKVFKGKMD